MPMLVSNWIHRFRKMPNASLERHKRISHDNYKTCSQNTSKTTCSCYARRIRLIRSQNTCSKKRPCSCARVMTLKVQMTAWINPSETKFDQFGQGLFQGRKKRHGNAGICCRQNCFVFRDLRFICDVLYLILKQRSMVSKRRMYHRLWVANGIPLSSLVFFISLHLFCFLFIGTPKQPDMGDPRRPVLRGHGRPAKM